MGLIGPTRRACSEEASGWMEGNLIAARAVGLATTGASLPPAASHATTSAKPISVAASANHSLLGAI